jgi:hypothetical protein
VLVNFPHARPELMSELTDADFSPEIIAGRYLAVTTAMEYEPIWVRERPSGSAREPARLVAGQGQVEPLRLQVLEKELLVEARDEARLRINTFYFPGWSVEVDGTPRPIDRGNPQGLMEIALEPGSHHVRVVFGDTPIRWWATRLSLLTAFVLVATPLLRGRRRSLAPKLVHRTRRLVSRHLWASLSTLRSRLVLVLIGGMVLFSLGTASMNWVKYISLRSTWANDLGFFHNAAFNLAQGRTITYFAVSAWFDRSEAEGPSIFRSPHFSPMQSLVMPQLYRPVPRVETLLLLQSVVLALGAWPLFRLGTRLTGDSRLGLALGLSYLLHPAMLHLAFNDYRPVALGIPLALLALWFHASRRPLPFVVTSLLMMSCQAEYLFLLALFGLINGRLSCAKERSVGWVAAPILLAMLWGGLTQLYYLYTYDRSWPILAFAAHGQPLEQRVLELGDRLGIFFRIGLVPAVMALWAPEVFAVAVPFADLATRVGPPSFPHHNLQHLSPALAAMFWGFAGGSIWLWRRLLKAKLDGRWLIGLLAAAALMSSAEFGWGAATTYLIGGFPRYDELTRINDALPADGTIVVPMDLAARFSNHSRVLTTDALPFPRELKPDELLQRAAYERVIGMCDLVAASSGQEWVDDLAERSGRFERARSVGGYRLYLARRDAARPANADLMLQQILGWERLSVTERRWL